MSEFNLTAEDLALINTRKGFKELLKEKNIDWTRVKERLEYEEELKLLQIELVKLQKWVQEEKKRVAIIFEGRDAAGKGSTIKRFMQYLSPRAMRVVALPKPSDVEKGQWYFQRYVKHLPNPGEIVFFDRSWYNRAVVEPAMGFCTKTEYKQFMHQVPEFEHMLYEDHLKLIKFWFAISKEEQQRRFKERETNPLKQWKLSPVDEKAQSMWDKYTEYKEKMFSKSHTSFSPWIIVEANNKRRARLESIRFVLSQIDYADKDKAAISLHPDPNIVMRYHRATKHSD
ncbi:MAG TPA: polyphosphate kinase 2 [Microscillaceae bacterium]|nr:polyphosphate kinase 2 [Microscillaceae bacterium]